MKKLLSSFLFFSFLFFSNITIAANANCRGPEDDFYCVQDFTQRLVGKVWLWQDQYFNNARIQVIGANSARIWYNGVHLGDFTARLIKGSAGTHNCQWAACASTDYLRAELWIMLPGHNYRVKLSEVERAVTVEVDGWRYQY